MVKRFLTRRQARTLLDIYIHACFICYIYSSSIGYVCDGYLEYKVEYTNNHIVFFVQIGLPLCNINLAFDICVCVIQSILVKGSIHIPVYKEWQCPCTDNFLIYNNSILLFTMHYNTEQSYWLNFLKSYNAEHQTLLFLQVLDRGLSRWNRLGSLQWNAVCTKLLRKKVQRGNLFITFCAIYSNDLVGYSSVYIYSLGVKLQAVQLCR